MSWCQSCWVKGETLECVKPYQTSKIPEQPGVYVIGLHRPLGRLGGTDDGGVLYVGSTSNLRNRVHAFGYGNHSASAFLWKFAELRAQILHAESSQDMHCSAALVGCWLNYSVLESQLSAEDAESSVLLTYYEMYGEFPPLNSSAPNRWREATEQARVWATAGLFRGA